MGRALRRRLGRRLGIVVALVVVAFVARPLAHLTRVAWHDERAAPMAGDDASVVDASRLERFTIAGVRTLPADFDAAVSMIRATFEEARRSGLAVSVAGARHSMGGQSIARDGLLIDATGLRGVTVDTRRRVASVRAGTRWSELIATLDPHGLAVAVMQANNVFTVGGSVSVNAHGWQPLSPPVGSSVESLRIVAPDGRLLRLSRDENADLFGLVLGGYGLFGVIVDVDLRVVPNLRYRVEQVEIPAADYARAFAGRVAHAGHTPGLAFGRLSVAPSRMLDTALLTVFVAEDAAPEALGAAPARRLPRLVFRGSVGSDYGKELRWNLERRFGQFALNPQISRNQAMNQDLGIVESHDPASTEVLQEYFVPPTAFAAFVEAMRAIVHGSGVDLLNVTVRDLAEDHDSFLRYADRDLLALVLLLHVPRSPAGDARLGAIEQRLIDAALAAGGRYYLPYRLHARADQFHRAYPRAREFFARKRAFDPEGLLSNELMRRHGAD